jgi:predicted metal-dependent peptidase
MSNRYFQICAETTADEMALDLSVEQIADLAGHMEHAVDMQSEATGAISYANPMEAEVREREEVIRRNEADHEGEVRRLKGVIDDWRRECRRLSFELEKVRTAS